MALLAAVYVSGLLAIIIIFLIMFRMYRKFIVPYKKFPWSFAVFKALPHFITGRLPKDTTRSSYIFQLFMKDFQKYFSEGCCVAWNLKPYLIVFNEEFIKRGTCLLGIDPRDRRVLCPFVKEHPVIPKLELEKNRKEQILSRGKTCKPTFSNEQTVLNKIEEYHIMREFFGSGLITSDAELWRKRRKLLQPAFHTSFLKSFIPIFNKNSSILVHQLKNEVTEEPVDIIRFLKTCSFSNLVATVFGLKPENRLSKSEEERYVDLVDTIQDLATERMANPFLGLWFWVHLLPIGRKFKKSADEGRILIEEILRRIRKTVIKENAEKPDVDDAECFSSQRKCFAEIIMQTHLQDPSFTMEDMIDETATVLTAGYDTVALTMMWCLFLLGHHPNVQEQIHDEVEYLAGKEITYEDLQGLTYTECVLKETLRLYPTVPAYGRHIEKDTQCGKYTVPKGTNLAFSTYLLHRNPEIYSNPSVFDPERFRNNAVMNHWGYRPFAEGVRNCIGKKYAMIQLKITLSYVLQNFKVTSLQPLEDIKGGWEIVLTPSKKVWLQLTPRK